MSKRLLLIFVVLVAAAFIIPTIANATFHRKIDPDEGHGAVTSFYCYINGVQRLVDHPKYCDNYKREEPKKLCEKYGITFPVKDLGNCPNYAACRQYCQDPLNQGKCLQFGNSKGISPKEVIEQDIRLGFKDSLIKLPCQSTGSCKTFCDQKTNFDKCSDFAQANKLVGGYIDNPGNDNIISKAKNVLGCSSPSDCGSFCTKPENQQKCTSFAGNIGLAGGERKVGPGGCTSPETCSSFCQDPQNSNKCAGFVVTPTTQTQKAAPITDQNPGPGGCTSDKNCDTFCSDPKNAEECTKYEESSGYQWKGPGGCTSPESCNAYCSKNYTDPECGGGGDVKQYEQQRQQYEQQRQQFEQQYQQQFQQKQQYEQQFKEAEQQKLQKQQEYEGAQQQYQQKQQEYQQGQQQYEQKQQEYQQQQQSQPQAPPSGVQGASTSRGLLQIILDWLPF